MAGYNKARVRRIHIPEWEMVAPLFARYRVFYKQPSDIDLARQFIRTRLENNESVVFAAFMNEAGHDMAVGFAQLYPAFSSVRAMKYWILNDLYVDQEHRKQGVGRQLIQAAMDFAKADNAEFVQLETAADNTAAQRLYETMGFIKEEPDYGFVVYRIKVR